jgi:hypothetical protein
MRSVAIIAIGLAASVCAAGPWGPQRIRVYSWNKRVQLPPVNEAAQDPSFEAFHRALIEAVKRRDAAFVIESTIPELQGRFSGRLDLPRSAFVGGREASEWGVLERLLDLGGAFTTTGGKERGRREFCAPYTYSSYPYSALQAPLAGRDENTEGSPWVILGARVPVHAAPKAGARVLTYLSHDLVIMGGGGEATATAGWQDLYTYDGWHGWVRADQVRDPRDYHACFAMIDGRWLMTTFSHGSINR